MRHVRDGDVQHVNEDRVRSLLQQLQAEYTAVATCTVRDLYLLFADEKRGARSWKTIEHRLRGPVEAFGDRLATSLTITDAEKYRLARRKSPVRRGKGRTYGDLTINYELGYLKAVLAWAVDRGHLAHNPLAKLKDKKTRKNRVTSPTEEEISALLEHASVLMRAFILFAADSGMRRDEIRLMRRDWIDEGASVVNLPAWATKGQKARSVPVTGRTFAALAAMPRVLHSPYPFANPDTEVPFSYVTIARWFRDVANAAGVQAAAGDRQVRIHDLRHSFARRFARAGVRLEIISLILGHANVQQTMVYLQTGADDIDDARETFEAALARRPAKHADKHVGRGRITIADE